MTEQGRGKGAQASRFARFVVAAFCRGRLEADSGEVRARRGEIPAASAGMTEQGRGKGAQASRFARFVVAAFCRGRLEADSGEVRARRGEIPAASAGMTEGVGKVCRLGLCGGF